MPGPGEHKTVQSRILAYAQEIGWVYVPREEAERRRGFDPDGALPEERARPASLYFDDLLHARVLAFNPKYKEAEGALVGELRGSNASFLNSQPNRGPFLYIKYDVAARWISE
jgi:type I restriction enzyme R subunit